MAKNSSLKNQRVVVAIGAILLVVVIALVSVFALQTKTASNGGNSQTPTPSEDGTVEISGTVMCLPHKEASGAQTQTMECAIGLKDDQDRYYALGDTDPGYKNVGGLSMDTEVIAIGTLTEEASETYPTIGTIKVTEIRKQ